MLFLRLKRYTVPTAPNATRRTIPAPNVIEVPDSPVLAAPATADLTAVVSAGAEVVGVTSRKTPRTVAEGRVVVAAGGVVSVGVVGSVGGTVCTGVVVSVGAVVSD